MEGFTKIDIIGKGGFAIVYLGSNSIGQQLAIK